MPAISDDILYKIKDFNDIIDVISERVHLKKAGRNYKGLCPFHAEKTPSFTVSPDKQFYHCFGCGEGGDVFTFVMKHENISFYDAIIKLAARAGITIPKNEKYKDKSKADLNEKLFAINNKAAEFFISNLKSKFGGFCQNYLKERGISADSINKFKIGCAQDSWDSLFAHLQNQGHSKELIEKAGLIVKKEGQSGYYDRFRKRIIFPIQSVGGNIIGFGGRVTDSSLPKYLNSPETPIFHKGYNLYALNVAKQAARGLGYLIIVEGYLDAITPHQYGVENVCATLGTSLTENHIRLIKRYVNKAVLIFDPDEAGIKAVLRGLEMFLKTDIKVNVVALPEKLDPDNFIKKYGKTEFLKELKKSVKILDFFINYIIDKTSVDTIDDKISIVNETLPKISVVRNTIERDYYIKKLSERLKIDEKLLRQELVKASKYPASRTAEMGKTLSAAIRPPIPKAEEILLRLIISNGSLAGHVKDLMSVEDFSDPIIKRIISKIFKLLELKKELKIDNIIKEEEEDVKSLISKLLVDEILLSDDETQKAFKDCLTKIQSDGIAKKMNEIQKLIEKAGKEKNEKLKEQLLKEYANIRKIKNELKKRHTQI
jgi:DNA primase